METKICITCGEEKPITDFWKGRNSCKSCRIAYNKQWILNHPEKMKNYDKVKYERHRDKILTRVKESYKLNPEPAKTRAAQFYWGNHDHVISRISAYMKTPKGKVQEAHNRHRRRNLINNTDKTLTLIQWEKILESQKNRCSICGKRFCKSRPPTMDHIIPLSKGGGLTFENVQALCRHCNSSKGVRIDKSLIVSWG